MNILRPAIEAKVVGSAIETDVSGRFYYETTADTVYPRICFSRVVSTPDNSFNQKGATVLIQFDLYSVKSSGISIMETMEVDLRSLFDDCDLTLSGNRLVGFAWTNTMSMDEDVTLPDGTFTVVHTIVEYEATYQKT